VNQGVQIYNIGYSSVVNNYVDSVEAKDCKYKLLTEGSTGF